MTSISLKRLFTFCLAVTLGLTPVVDLASDLPMAKDVLFDNQTRPRVVAFNPAAVVTGRVTGRDAPDFAAISSTQKRKQAFYDYLIPRVRAANLEVTLERRWLMSVANQLVEGTGLDPTQLENLAKMEKRYALRGGWQTQTARVAELLLRVETVPASLVIAQAAKETGWGRSRFATEANNYFGIWCFYQGCGIKPQRRDQGRRHEVATFASVDQSVRYYIRTLNTHLAYADFRQLRMNQAHLTERPGEQLAVGLLRYSERGEAYVTEIQAMIRYNELQRFNQANSV